MAITPIEARCRRCHQELLLGDLRDVPDGLCPGCGYPLAPDWWDYALSQASLADPYLEKLVGVLRHLVQLPGNLELEPHSVLRNLVEEVGWEEQLAAEPDALGEEIGFLREELDRWSALAPPEASAAWPAACGSWPVRTGPGDGARPAPTRVPGAPGARPGRPPRAWRRRPGMSTSAWRTRPRWANALPRPRPACGVEGESPERGQCRGQGAPRQRLERADAVTSRYGRRERAGARKGRSPKGAGARPAPAGDPRPPRQQRRSGSGVDGPLPPAGGDLDLAGLGLLRHGDGEGQDPLVVVGLDVVTVQVLAQEQLTGEAPLGPLGQGDLDPLLGAPGTLSLDGEHITLHRDVYRLRVHPGQVHVDNEVVSPAVGIEGHGHDGRTALGTPHLLGQAVQLPEGIGTHQRHRMTSCLVTVLAR